MYTDQRFQSLTESMGTGKYEHLMNTGSLVKQKIFPKLHELCKMACKYAFACPSMRNQAILKHSTHVAHLEKCCNVKAIESNFKYIIGLFTLEIVLPG